MNAFGFKEPLRSHTWFFWKQSKHLGFMSAMFNQNQLKRHTTTAFKNKVKSVTTASWDMTSLGLLESSTISTCSSTIKPIKNPETQQNTQPIKLRSDLPLLESSANANVCMQVKIKNKKLGDLSHNRENITKEANFSMNRQQHNIATIILLQFWTDLSRIWEF